MRTLFGALAAAAMWLAPMQSADAVTLNFAPDAELSRALGDNFIAAGAVLLAPTTEVDGEFTIAPGTVTSRLIFDVTATFEGVIQSFTGTVSVYDGPGRTPGDLVEVRSFTDNIVPESPIEIIVMGGYEITIDLLATVADATNSAYAARLTAVPVPPAALLLLSALAGAAAMRRYRLA